MAYEATSVSVSRSQEEIRKLIMGNGGTGIAFVSQRDPLTEGFEAMMSIDGKPYRVRIVAKVKKVENNSRARRYRGRYIQAKSDNEAQETEFRRVWRVLFYHLKSVYEASNSGVMEFREIIMPYVVTHDGRTVAEHILPKLDQAIAGRPERLLPAPRDAA
jgi:hypothetical protein